MIATGKNDTKFKICTIIRNRLIEDSSVYGYVQNQIYPIVAPEGIDGPFILYRRENYSISKTNMQIYKHLCKIIITCASSSYDEAQDMADAVFKNLQGIYNYRDASTGLIINDVTLTDSTEDYAGDLYLETLCFDVD